MKPLQRIPYLLTITIAIPLFFAVASEPIKTYAMRQVNQPGDCLTVVDTLRQATPQTKFSLPGSSGVSILPTQFIGPRFTLTQSAVLSEIGAFINLFPSSPPCANPLPF